MSGPATLIRPGDMFEVQVSADGPREVSIRVINRRTSLLLLDRAWVTDRDGAAQEFVLRVRSDRISMELG